MNGKINIDNLFKAAFKDFEAQPSSEMLDNILGDAFDTSVQSSFEDFTLAPSTHIWENINEFIPTEADKLLSASFDEFAVTPPTHLWENISESIPAEADKLLSASFDELAVTPPTHLWENISESIPSEVDQLLANSFDEFEVTPPTGMWASIQGELDVEEHFDAKFQEAFTGFAPEPSEHILNNLLNTKFDTGVRRTFMRHEVEPHEVIWEKIKPYIRFGPTIQRHLPTVRRMAAVILCLLMFTFLYHQFDRGFIDDLATEKSTKTDTTTDDTPGNPTQNEAEQPLQSTFNTSTEGVVSVEEQPVNREAVEETTDIDRQLISQSSLLGNEKSRFDLDGSSLPPESTDSDKAILRAPKFTETTPTENKRTDDLISSISSIETSGLKTYTPNIIISNPDLSNFDALEVTTAARGYGNEYTIQSNLLDMDEDNDLAKMMLSYRGWYVSSSFAGFYSRIHNDVVREGLSNSGQYSMDYEVDSGVSFGIGAGYQFTPNFGIEAEVMRSNLSQSYRELTAQNIYNTKNVAHTTYFYIPLSFKYQIRRSNSMNRRIPSTFSTVLGMHYGKLQSIKFGKENYVAPGTEDALIQQELGVFTGLDWHFYASPNMHVTLGGRLAGGTDFEYLSAPFATGTPYNIQAGVRVGLNYRFATRRYKWDRGIY